VPEGMNKLRHGAILAHSSPPFPFSLFTCVGAVGAFKGALPSIRAIGDSNGRAGVTGRRLFSRWLGRGSRLAAQAIARGSAF
jgi:hypothetical protein